MGSDPCALSDIAGLFSTALACREETGARLAVYGFTALAQIADTPAAELCSIAGLGERDAEALKEAAQQWLTANAATAVEQ